MIVAGDRVAHLLGGVGRTVSLGKRLTAHGLDLWQGEARSQLQSRLSCSSRVSCTA